MATEKIEGRTPPIEKPEEGEPRTPPLDRIEAAIEERLGEIAEDVHRFVLAGEKIIYGSSTHQKALGFLQQADDPLNGAVMGVAALISMIHTKAKNASPDVMVAASMLLLVDVLDFLAKSGRVELNDENVGNAFELLMRTMAQKLGIGEEQLEGAAGGQPEAPMPGDPQGGQPMPPQGGQPMPPQGGQPPQGGLINGGM